MKTMEAEEELKSSCSRAGDLRARAIFNYEAKIKD